MTPNHQDWVEGLYVFDLVDTTSINLELTWAIREFDRDSLGMGSGTTIGDTLESTDGLDANDGAPADLIRESFDLPTGGTNSPTVGQKLKTEVNNAIEDALSSGFGTVTSISTDYITSYTNEGVPTECSTDSTNDALAEGAEQDNVFEPPLCFTSQASVELAAGSFNLAATPDLDLERTYRGLLGMGAEINTGFELTAQPGHKANFIINPPSYSTVLSVDDNGTLAARSGPPSYWAGEWGLDHLSAAEVDGSIVQPVDMEMGHRNSSTTPTVWIEDGSKALDITMVLDLRDDTAATVDFAAALYYLDDATLSDWGINMFEVSSAASIPVITSDGIRLAYHNGIVDLTQFTNEFPIAEIVEGLGSTVAGVGEISMSDMTWVSETDGTGIFSEPGGLNYTHSIGCTEPVSAGQVLHYCLEGTNAMDASFPVYLQTTSQPFNMSLVDILKEYNSNEMIDDFLTGVQEDDLKRLMNSGISLETVLSTSYLDAIIPPNLPPSEMTVEILLPTWINTKDNTSKIVLEKTIEGTQETDISFQGVRPYDWRHAICIETDPCTDASPDVICFSNQSSCVSSDVQLDWEKFNINEWTQSVSVTMSLDAEFSIYRIGIPTEYLPNGATKVSMEAIPSDLVRLIIDLSSRMEEPLSSGQMNFCGDNDDLDIALCDGEKELLATRQGLKDFTVLAGETVTGLLHQVGTELEESENIETMDLSKFIIETEISGIEAPDGVVSDETPITLKVTIPEVTFKIGIEADFEKLQNEDPSGMSISVVTSAFTSVFYEPMKMTTQALGDGLANSYIGLDGISYPAKEDNPQSFTTPVIDPEMEEDFDLRYTGPISFTLPKGITLVDFSSSSGRATLSEDDGRQTITYLVPPGEFQETITYRLHISAMFFLMQFWVYPTIVLLLLVLFVRRRIKKKKRKKDRGKSQQAAINKAQMGDHEFADLAGFSSPGLRRGESIEEMAEIEDY